MYTYIPITPHSSISLPPSLSQRSRWSQSTKLISLCYAAASHQLSILHLVVYICQCCCLTSSQLTFPTPWVLKSFLYFSVFIPVLPQGSGFYLVFGAILQALPKTEPASLSAAAFILRNVLFIYFFFLLIFLTSLLEYNCFTMVR